MILTLLIAEVLVGGVLAWIASRWSPWWPRWISLATLAVPMVVLIALWVHYFAPGASTPDGPWLVEVNRDWIPQLGIHFHLAMDGLSLILLVLTNFVGIISVATSWNAIKERVGFFHFNLLWIVAAIMGVFTAVDLFLFYFFWEMMLIPLYFLIGLWGYENRTYASVKFFLFTQAGGVLMLAAILGLYFVHGRATGVYTFDYSELLGTPMAQGTARLLMLGFFAAFAVKLPAVPVHTWLPDAHTQAPTAGSLNLAALVLKVGAYGMIRFMVPLFPKAALDFAPIAMGIAVAGIIYGAVLAFSQTDIKRLVAYTSVSHMGFVLLGIFAWNELSLAGRRHDHTRPRDQHGRPLHPGRRPEREDPYARNRRYGRTVVGGAEAGRGGAVLRYRLPGPARAGELRRRVPGSARHLPDQCADGRPRHAGADRLGHLLAVDDPGRFPGAERAQVEAARHYAAGGGDPGVDGGNRYLARRLPAEHPRHHQAVRPQPAADCQHL